MLYRRFDYQTALDIARGILALCHYQLTRGLIHIFVVVVFSFLYYHTLKYGGVRNQNTLKLVDIT